MIVSGLGANLNNEFVLETVILTSIRFRYHSEERFSSNSSPRNWIFRMNGLRLLAMRHAKSSWKNENLVDFDRPLNRRGRNAAPLMARVLFEKKLIPDLILSSAAKRAQQTTELMVQTWARQQAAVEAVFLKSLYLGSPENYSSALAQLGTRQNIIMLVGHNPGIEHLIEHLTGQEATMPTAAVAIMACGASWQEQAPARLLNVVRPKDFLDG